MPRQRRVPRRTARVITAYRPWTDRVPRGRRYLHMRVLPTFFVETGVFMGVAALGIGAILLWLGDQPTPDLCILAGWFGLGGGLCVTLKELKSRPDRVIW